VLEGQVPTRKDFSHAAVLIFGIHYAGSGINKLYHIYKTYGIHPRDMETLAQRRDDVKADLLDPDVQEPRALGELNEAFIKGLEEEANIKLVEAPKVELEAKVAVEGTGSREGIVRGLARERLEDRLGDLEATQRAQAFEQAQRAFEAEFGKDAEYPQVAIGSKHIGSLKETLQYMNEQGMFV